jgi:hypothetical protein
LFGVNCCGRVSLQKDPAAGALVIWRCLYPEAQGILRETLGNTKLYFQLKKQDGNEIVFEQVHLAGEVSDVGLAEVTTIKEAQNHC